MPSFPYLTADKEFVACNQCDGRVTESLHQRDRNGLPVQAEICKRCGLIYLNPRMIPTWYDRYYQEEYRQQMARFKGRKLAGNDSEKSFVQSTRHGSALARRFSHVWQKGLTVEVGSSVGGVLNGIRSGIGCEVLGIEPSPLEAEEANKRGIRTFNSSIETLKEEVPVAANILCTQSLNHLLDPRFFLRWAHAHLAPHGRLILEVMNFRHVFTHFGWIQRAIQIDHTYMFVPEVLESFVAAAGFKTLLVEADENKSPADLNAQKKEGLPVYHMTLVAERTAQVPFSSPIREYYPQVRASLAQLPNSRWRYTWRSRVVRKLHKWRLIRDSSL